jgi:transketolase
LPLAPLDGKLAAFGWAAETVDGRDHQALERALRRRADDRPVAVVADVEAQ